jgi:hypothetical protein
MWPWNCHLPLLILDVSLTIYHPKHVLHIIGPWKCDSQYMTLNMWFTIYDLKHVIHIIWPWTGHSQYIFMKKNHYWHYVTQDITRDNYQLFVRPWYLPMATIHYLALLYWQTTASYQNPLSKIEICTFSCHRKSKAPFANGVKFTKRYHPAINKLLIFTYSSEQDRGSNDITVRNWWLHWMWRDVVLWVIWRTTMVMMQWL